MTKIKNKTVLITGGANGIGKLIGEKCLKKGAAKLVIWDINEPLLQQVTTDLTKKGYEVHSYLVDVSDLDDIKTTAEAVLEDVGNVDILFNNAGIVVGKKFEQHSTRDIEKIIRINVLGVMHVAHAFLPGMLQMHRGHIINIASATGLMPNPNMSVYVASKYAVLGWSESLRIEQDQAHSGVHVTTICPSYINTGMFEGVKAPLLTPILEPDYISNRIIEAVEKDEMVVMEPPIVRTLPALRGLLPARAFDYLATKVFKVYDSMSDFKGRPKDVAVPDKKKPIKQ